jgi:hypothetical protein
VAKVPSYSKWALAAIAGGVTLTAIEVVGAVGYLVSQNQPSYLVAGGAVVTVVAAILPILAGRCWRGGRYALAVMLYLAMVPALSVILCAAIERTGGAKDTADRDRQAIAQKIELARDAVKDAKADVVAAEAKATAECATGRGPKCLQLEAKVEAARKRVEAARGEVAQAGVVPKDPMASRLAAVLPVSEAAISLYQPLILPLAISITGLLLITVGAHSPRRRKVQKRMGRRKRRPQPKLPPSAKVIPLRRRA